MPKDPILRQTPPDAKRRVVAYGGLHYIRGNQLPYFSLTGETKDSAGCIHETLLRKWPELGDLAALHLSDINGVPMHAAENGWYWLQGALPAYMQGEFHGGNSKGHHGGEYRAPTPDECLAILAEHLRINIDIAKLCALTAVEEYNKVPLYQRVYLKEGVKAAKADFVAFCDSLKPMWANQAKACIAKHGLVVYGDTYTPTKTGALV